MARKVPEHPCKICGEPTTNPITCSRKCGVEHARRSPNKGYKTPISIEERFFSFVPKNLSDEECWPWIGRIDEQGYGKIGETIGFRKYRMLFAHRVAWELHRNSNGRRTRQRRNPIPEGHVVIHICETRSCVNPKHLRCGPRGIQYDKKYRLFIPHAPHPDDAKSVKLTSRHVRLLRLANNKGREDVIKAVAESCGTTLDYARRVAKGQARHLVPDE